MARKVRVPGGFTVFHWNSGSGNEVIAFADEVRVAAVTPVAPAQVIQPLNYLRPAEIVTPRAHTNGVITLVLTELYNEAVWQRLAGLSNSRDIIDIMEYVAGLDNGIRVTKFVRTPKGADYYETFHNCVVTRVQDDEAIRIDTMVLNKEIELWYTHSIKNYPRLPNTARAPFFT